MTQCTTTIPSSVASTVNKVHYPVDDIDRPVACSLVIRYGINNHRTREVAVGLAIPGHNYHGSDIPEDYCKVEVSTVVQGYKDDMLDIPGPEGIEKLRQAIKNFIHWPRRDVQLSEPPPSSQAPPLTQDLSAPADPLSNPPSSPPFNSPPSPPPSSQAPPLTQDSSAPADPLPNPPSSPIVAPIDPPSSSPPFNSPSSPPPKDPKQTREAPKRPKKKFPIPKLVFPFQQKKKTAGTTKFLAGIALSRTTRTLDLAEHDKLAEKPKVITVSIRKPTMDDYKNVPDKYMPERPLLKWGTLKKISAGVKRLHDWYMRASSFGIDTINVSIPPAAFVSGRQTVVITFEDMWLMMNLQRLDVQLVTVFAL
jgi:hypothetical protein